MCPVWECETYSSTSHNLFQDQHNKKSNNKLSRVRTNHGKLQHMFMYSKLKGSSLTSAIFDAIKIIDVALWSEILLLTVSCVPESMFDYL